MKMKKVTSLLAMTVAAVMAMTGCGGNDAADESTGNKVYHIGIIQQMEHGSLDQATKGFEDKLTELLGEDNVEFDYQNAQGEQANCTTISTKFVSDGCDLIIGGNQMDSLFLLTQNSGKILGPIAKVLGYLMNAIYVFMDKFLNIQNVGLTIIVFTIVIYFCLLPLTYKQQKFSKMSQIMNPEIQAIQKKYKNRRDQAFPFISRWCMYKLLPDNAWRTFWTVMVVVFCAYILRSVFTYIITYWGHSWN